MFYKIKQNVKKIDNKYFNSFFKTLLNKVFKQDPKKFKSNSFATLRVQKYKKLDYWNNLFNHLVKNKLEGDIIECGVGNGLTLSLILYNILKHKKNFIDNKKCYGFDSFEGFPEATIHDLSSRNIKLNRKSIITKADSSFLSIDFVKNNFKNIGFNDADIDQNIFFKKGFFKETFEDFSCNKISLLHLDCDLYESYKLSLEKFYSKVVENGIIAFDEYEDDQSKWPGAAKAINEFFGEKTKKFIKDDLSKKIYYIKN